MHCRRWASSCFFLVTALSRQHLALAALPLVRSSEESSSSAAYSVVWSSPAPGDRFGPGDTIVGEWQVTPQKVVSPSFRLCAGGEDGCGATVWPEVVEESEGSHYASLTAPSVNTESGYYLQMKDDFGHAFSSPIFNITPTPQKKNKPAAHPPDVAQPEQAPMSSSLSSSSSTGTKSKGDITDSNPAAAPAAAPETPNGNSSPPSAASGVSPSSPATSIPPMSNINSSGSGGSQVAAAHNAPPTAALAVPLSLAGAIILLAGGLALHHRRRLTAEKQRSWSKAAQLIRGGAGASDNDDGDVAASESALLRRMRSHSSRLGILHLGGGGNGNSRRDNEDDVEKALFARALFRGAAAALSDHHTHDTYYDRRLPEKTAPAAPAAAGDPLYSYSPYGAPRPQPRQRTRELDLLEREFTTSTTARPRPRAHPSRNPSSSSSSYRGLWGGRGYSSRCSTTGNTNGSGGSSLWRSLSFAAARPKKVVAPRVSRVPPPSSLNSPAMTAVMSVTSEVLPSYLPSPTLVGDVVDQARGDEHVAGVGDFVFEDVPLSPPLPSPLHTRGEAADPDDSRMRELRDVYEAVSRALGSVQRV